MEAAMTMSRADAVRTCRPRLKERGLSRFAAMPTATSSARSPACWRRTGLKPSASGPHWPALLRATLSSKGNIVAALRRSPLVGADLDLGSERVAGRDVDL
jgi:hypothetical protein